MTRNVVATVLSVATLIAFSGSAVAQGLNYSPPGAAYAAIKNQMEDKKNLINGLYNQTHIRSTIKSSLRDVSPTAYSFTSEDDDGVDGPVVNGVLVAPTATVEGDLNVFIDLDGDTLVLTE